MILQIYSSSSNVQKLYQVCDCRAICTVLVGCCCEMKSIKHRCAWSSKAFSKHTTGFVTEVWIWFKWRTFKLLWRRQVCVCVLKQNKNEWSQEILFAWGHSSIQVNHLEIGLHLNKHRAVKFKDECSHRTFPSSFQLPHNVVKRNIRKCVRRIRAEF